MEGNKSHSLTIEKVKVKDDNTIVGEGYSQEKKFLIQGSLVKATNNIYKFKFKREFNLSGGDVVYFEGKYMKDTGKLEGTWGRTAGLKTGSCRFFISTIASINIKTMQGASCRSSDSEYVQFDTKTLKFTSTKESGKGINMQSVEHLDNC
jgi:hypothetical protein